MTYDSLLEGSPQVYSFFDSTTFTITYVVVDTISKDAAIIDSVLDYEPNSASVSYKSADRIVALVEQLDLKVKWILETHAHADHLTASVYLKNKLGGKTGIGEKITVVQDVFADIFNIKDDSHLQSGANQFDHLFKDGEEIKLGEVTMKVLHTPGHTPSDVTYIFGSNAFVGDAIFMPDFGTARTDFPGGSASDLYDSIQKIFTLPNDTNIFVGHDYLAEGRDEYAWQTTVSEEKEKNVYVGGNVQKNDFVSRREERDAKLSMPRLIIPAIQINIRAGNFPDKDENGTSYLRVPINKF